MIGSLPSDEEVRRQLLDVRSRVMDAVRTEQSPRRSTTFRRARGLVIVGVVGLGLTAGGVFVASSSVDREATVRCYSNTSLNSSMTEAMSAGVQQTDESSGDFGGHLPTVVCSAVWSAGHFIPGVDQNEIDHIYPVPPLAACTLSNGMAAVFPNREELPAAELCGTLGLAEWDSDSGV